MNILLIIGAFLIQWIGFRILSHGAEIAKRQKTNVWTAAKPEAGAGFLLIALALLMAAVAGGWI